MSGELRVLREEDGVVVLEIDNPPMNAMNPEMLQAFMNVLDLIESDTKLRCLVIAGMGKAFCAGEDLKELSTTGEELHFFMSLVERLEVARVPVIAAVNGFCVGGGLELALCADICLASEKASFICAGANMGGLSEPYRLIRLVGHGNAKEMLFTGERYDAATAQRFGLVTQIHPPEELRPAALRMAKRIASRAPLTVEAMKRVSAQVHLPPKEIDRVFHDELLGILKSQDFQEGVASFRERREPKFSRQ